MKRRSFLETLIKKAGHLTDDELNELLADLDGELDDTKAAQILADLLTPDEAIGNDVVFGKAKNKAKAEALDPIDKMLKPYENKLSTEQKAAYGKLGTDSYKKYNFLLKTFDELGTKTGDKNFDDLKAEFDTLQGKINSGEYVPKSDVETFQSAASKAQRDATNKAILLAAVRSNKLRDVSGDRHFERNFIADVDSLLEEGIGEGNKKLKGVIDHTTGKVMRADDPERPLLIGSKAATIADIANLAIDQFEWAKKSDNTTEGVITVKANPSNATGLTAAQRRNLEMEERENK